MKIVSAPCFDEAIRKKRIYYIIWLDKALKIKQLRSGIQGECIILEKAR